MWVYGCVTESWLRFASINAPTEVKICLETALFAAAVCRRAAGRAFTGCKGKSELPQSAAVCGFRACAGSGFFEERLNFSCCKLSIHPLDANFKTVCVFKEFLSQGPNLNTNLAIPQNRERKRPHRLTFPQWIEVEWDLQSVLYIFFLKDTNNGSRLIRNVQVLLKMYSDVTMRWVTLAFWAESGWRTHILPTYFHST